MLKVLLLLCPMSMDRAACQVDTALEQARLGMTAMPEQCAVMGMFMSAGSDHLHPTRSQYLKVVCLRETDAGYARSAAAQ